MRWSDRWKEVVTVMQNTEWVERYMQRNNGRCFTIVQTKRLHWRERNGFTELRGAQYKLNTFPRLWIEVKCVISFVRYNRKTTTFQTCDTLCSFVCRAKPGRQASRAGARVKSSIKTDYTQLVAQRRIRAQECEAMVRNWSETLSETCWECPVYASPSWW